VQNGDRIVHSTITLRGPKPTRCVCAPRTPFPR
jgi:hypothetical protein